MLVRGGLLVSSSLIHFYRWTENSRKGIKKETSTATKFVEELNNISQTDEAFVPLRLDDVISPESEFWQ